MPDTVVPDTVVPDAVAGNTTPIYKLDVNDDGTVTLPGGAVVPEAIADSAFEQTYLLLTMSLLVASLGCLQAAVEAVEARLAVAQLALTAACLRCGETWTPTR